MKDQAIESILFTVKQTKKTIYDVGIDLKEREYRIETTDLYGHTQGPILDGQLRRSSVKKFLASLNDRDFHSWKKLEQGILPLKLKSATVMYSVDGEMYYTQGSSDDDLAYLHKEIEQLIGTTFGTYEFYK